MSTNQIQLNFTGFSTRVFIDKEKMSATDISLSASENLISFEGAYGGNRNDGKDEDTGRDYFRLNTPSFYELPNVSCSIGCEMTYSQIKTHFFNWLENRGMARKINISSGKKENQTFNFHECYFNSLRLSTSENSLVTANYDFFVLSNGIHYEKVYKFEEDSDSSSSETTWSAVEASELSDSSSSSGFVLDYGRGYTSYSFFDEPLRNDVLHYPYNGSDGLQYRGMTDPTFDMETKGEVGDAKKTPIAYWETKISGFKDGKNVIGWDLSITQSVIPKYYCGRSDDNDIEAPVLPDIMIGHPKMELTVSFLIDKEAFNENVFKIFSGEEHFGNDFTEIIGQEKLTLEIRGNKFCKFVCGRVVSYSPSLSTNGALTFSVTYQINQIQLLY